MRPSLRCAKDMQTVKLVEGIVVEPVLANYIAAMTGCDALLHACKAARDDESCSTRLWHLLSAAIAKAEPQNTPTGEKP